MTDTLDASTPDAEAALLGRTRIMPRALSRLVAAVTANILGVGTGEVTVGLADDRGLLALTISAPIRVVSLSWILQDRSLVERTGGPLLQRAVTAEQAIGEQVAELTGSRIGPVTLRLTGTRIRVEGRVR